MTTITRSTSSEESYARVARFDNPVEALMCLPVIGSMLRCNLHLFCESGSPSNIISLPNGCSFEQGGIAFRYLP